MANLKDRIASLSPRQQTLLAQRLSRSEEPTDGGPVEAIAVVGLACRFPGNVDSPEAFWELLMTGRDAVCEVPEERWDPEATTNPGALRWGGFLNQVDYFDGAFFGISPREAAFLDPQHRLLLEVAWEALEEAGLPPESLAGEAAGVFAALYHRDYGRLAFADPAGINAYVSSGTHHSLAANRLSYHLDLRGPSLVVDTACSSSLVAIHLACQSLRQGECDLALVGAANLMLLPEETLAMAQWGMLAKDGRVKAFDSRADGFVRGEGCGVVVLKRMADARADNEEVHALIRGTAVNQDGRSNGLTAPNGEAQTTVIRRALAASGLSPAEITYVETHGTGTRLGDPIEVEALVAALGAEGPPCLLGAVKANLGHLEAAAGMAGLMKTILCLRHRQVPPQIHLAELSPLLPLKGTRLAIPTESSEWKGRYGICRAGISSFGMGGTNAHVIVEEAPKIPEPPQHHDEDGAYLLPLSARSPQALSEMAAAFHRQLSEPDPQDSSVSLADLAATASLRRAHHEHRLAFLARSRPELCEQLATVAQGEGEWDPTDGEPVDSGRLVFVFPGQGWQWFGMGRRLNSTEEVFRNAVERAAAAVGRYADFDLLAAWQAGPKEGQWSKIDVMQPILFALQVALAAQWRAWGVEPDAVIGHSLGEVAAAHVAGALTLDDAACVVCHRSHLLSRVRGGAMATVNLSRVEAEKEISKFSGRLVVAAENGIRSTVLAGDPETLDGVVSRLGKRGIFCRRIAVDVASHSPWVDSLSSDLPAALRDIAPRPASALIYSTVSETRSEGADFDAAYWQHNLRQPVHFWSAVERALADGHDIFLELSGHPILLPAMEPGLAEHAPPATLLTSWRRDRNERAEMLLALGELYRRGFPIAWRRLYPQSYRKVHLPPYPWQRQRFWIPASKSRAPRPYKTKGASALLGALRLPLGGVDGVYVWQGEIDPRDFPFLAEHRVEESAILPGVAYLSVLSAAAVEAFGERPFTFREVNYLRPLLLEPPPVVQWTLRRASTGQVFFECLSRPKGQSESWTLHAVGRLCFTDGMGSSFTETVNLDEIRHRCGGELAGERFYGRAYDNGNQWGPSFRSVERIYLGRSEVLIRLRTVTELLPQLADHPFHPAVLDACGQPLTTCLQTADVPGGAFVLGEIEKVRLIGRPGSTLWSHIQLREEQESGRLRGDIRAIDDHGVLLAELRGLAIDFPDHRQVGRLYESLYTIAWRQADFSPLPRLNLEGNCWLIFADSHGVGRELGRRFREGGSRTMLVTAGESFEPLADQPPTSWRVVDLRGLDLEPDDLSVSGTPSAADAAARCSAALELFRKLRSWSSLVPRGLWWITAGAQAVDAKMRGEAAGSSFSPIQATLWGLARSVDAEHPGILAGCVDLEPGLDIAKAAELLEQEIVHCSEEDEVAWRFGRRYVPRLERRPFPGRHQPEIFSPTGSYLITGGLGDLGLAVARRIVERGARRLVLLSRTPLPPRRKWRDMDPGSPAGQQSRAVLELEQLGASIHLAAVDVSQKADLQGFLETFATEGWPPIRGVIHAAGVQDPRPALELDKATLEKEFAAKVSGGVFLHQAFATQELEFFVLFSSAATFLRSPFLAAYTASNAALVALAQERRRQGLPALAVDWGFWSQIGMAERRQNEEKRRLLPDGMRSFSPAWALDLLECFLRSEIVRIAVLPIDWKTWAEAYPTAAAAPLLAEVLCSGTQDLEMGKVEGKERPTQYDLSTLDDVPPKEQRQMLAAYLSKRLAQVLRTSTHDLSLNVPLTRLGLDSLMAIEFRNFIHTDLGRNVPIIRLMSSLGLSQLIEEIRESSKASAAVKEFEEWTL